MSDASGRKRVARETSDGLAHCLPAMHDSLTRERSFRIEQLAGQTSRTGGSSPRSLEDAVQQEINDAVLAGARRALTDIERALGAIRLGRYGECGSRPIPLSILRAVPRTRFCLDCQCADEPIRSRAPPRHSEGAA